MKSDGRFCRALGLALIMTVNKFPEILQIPRNLIKQHENFFKLRILFKLNFHSHELCTFTRQHHLEGCQAQRLSTLTRRGIQIHPKKEEFS